MSVDRHLALTAYLKAKSQCREWAKSFDLGEGITFFSKEKSRPKCQEENQKIDSELEQRRINRIYSYSQQSGVLKTNFYINNTGIEKALYLADGSEQAQWIQIGNRRFCGLIKTDLAFLETPQSMIVRVLSSGQEFSYLRVSRNAGEEIFRATSRKFKTAQYLERSKSLTFFNINRQGNRQSEISSTIS